MVTNFTSTGEKNQSKDDKQDVDDVECCSNIPIYEIAYNNIPRKWLVCRECIELEFFKTGIENQVRIKS